MVEFPWCWDERLDAAFESEHHLVAGFDGNRSDALRHWMFPNERFEADKDEMIDNLAAMTFDGNLFWTVFLVPVDQGDYTQ